jgi:hypothetical protein
VLLSKNAGACLGINYQNIAHSGAQSVRSGRNVIDPPVVMFTILCRFILRYVRPCSLLSE